MSASLAAAPKLTGTVGPGITITLTRGGKRVTKLTAGAYTFAHPRLRARRPPTASPRTSPRSPSRVRSRSRQPRGGYIQVLLLSAREHDVRPLVRLVARRARSSGARAPKRGTACGARTAQAVSSLALGVSPHQPFLRSAGRALGGARRAAPPCASCRISRAARESLRRDAPSCGR